MNVVVNVENGIVGECYRGWRRRFVVLTLLAGLLFTVGRMRSGVPRETHVGNLSQRPTPIGLGTEIIQVGQEPSEAAVGVPQVSVHPYLVEFSVTSPDAATIVTEVKSGFEAALADFNDSLIPHSGEFATSEALARLIKSCESKGIMKIRNEQPRIISNGQTDTWGNALSISARPTIESENDALVSLSVHAERF